MASPKTNKAQINKIIYWQTHPLEWVKDIFGDNIKKSPLASKLTDSGLSKQQEDALLQWGEFLDAKLKYAFKKPMTDDEQVLAGKIGMSIMSGTGTGKDLIAKKIHERSTKFKQPFVTVNLASISPSLFESELFGHEKGAFTGAAGEKKGYFEIANGGSIFLDEIGALNFTSQVKLLRVLQDQTFERLGDPNSITVDVRVLSATNHNLYSLVNKGSFREDLLYRINLIQIEVPPLRLRTNDIPLLAEYFLSEAVKTYSLSLKSISKDAIGWLVEQQWPGNVRELKNIMERTHLLTTGDQIKPQDFILAQRTGRNPGGIDPADCPLGYWCVNGCCTWNVG